MPRQLRKQRPERAVGICPRFSKSNLFSLVLYLYLSNRKLKKCFITKFSFLWYQNKILIFYKTLESITKWYKEVLALVLLNLIELRAFRNSSGNDLPNGYIELGSCSGVYITEPTRRHAGSKILFEVFPPHKPVSPHLTFRTSLEPLTSHGVFPATLSITCSCFICVTHTGLRVISVTR